MSHRSTAAALALALVFCVALAAPAADRLRYNVPDHLQKSKLFVTLPSDLVATPDSMAVHPNGDLVLTCPNFGDLSMPGRLVRIDRDRRVHNWFEVPVNPRSGVARPMGLDFDPEGNLYLVDNQGWTGRPECVDQGRILKIEFDQNDKPAKVTEVVTGMEHPNGVKFRNGRLYVTQSCMNRVKDFSGKLVSALYCFPADAKGIVVQNTLDDANIIATFITVNPDIQYGVDGLVFDKRGNLYVGNFGDGAVNKLMFNEYGAVKSNLVWAQNQEQLMTTDGMCIDGAGNIYVADFSPNAVAKVTPMGRVTRIAQSPDSNGAEGQLDQPGEPIIWDGKLILSCFDMVTDDGKVNSAHDYPQTLAYIELN